ncbi:antibiotic biosynthesis monooxygenase family protein [Sphingomonas flavalba]|uniref:antibiotic biosynthesis monooxygenase family protein n=1 Tax=Sphingomonas flavalba TaxID=2559804 RepID=UPI0039DF2EC9
MAQILTGMTAVIFVSTRSADDDAGYAAAADAMVRLAARQPGYVAMTSVRAEDRRGITVSYWADEAAALAWRDQPEHAAIRERGRGVWYDDYQVVVATVDRAYAWGRA